MDVLLDLLKAAGVAGLGLLMIVAAGFSLWKAATRKATLEAAREINEQEQAEVKRLVDHAEQIRADTTDPEEWL